MGWWLVKRAALCSLGSEAVLKMLDDGKRQGARDRRRFYFSTTLRVIRKLQGVL